MIQAAGLCRVRFLPLAITRVDDRFGCVGAVRDHAEGWIRPEPTYLRDLEAADSVYTYDRWTVATVGPSSAQDARPEDRDVCLTAEAPCAAEVLPKAERPVFLESNLDPDVNTAFAGERSLGLVRVELHRFYVRRSTGGRHFLRAEFTDRSSQDYDWIIPDLAFGARVWPHVVAGQLDSEFETRLRDAFAHLEIYFALGLTKPNDRFPGRFRGCHPLVVGIHTVPDYRSLPAIS